MKLSPCGGSGGYSNGQYMSSAAYQDGYKIVKLFLHANKLCNVYYFTLCVKSQASTKGQIESAKLQKTKVPNYFDLVVFSTKMKGPKRL